MRYARRVDANLDEIVSEFERQGCVIDRTNSRWDLTVQYAGLTMLVEVKDGAKPPSARKLTPAEEKTHARMMVRIVKDKGQAAECAAVLRTWAGFIRAGFLREL